jgi:CRISPR-associated exonuclease Cas4
MYDEADLLPISALQHLAFCERQWALIHLEGLWAENRLTVEGRHLHDRTHQTETESRGDLRIARGLRLRSLRLGLTGIADVVEFHRVPEVAQCPPPGPFDRLRAGSAALTAEGTEPRRVPEHEAATVGQANGLPGGVPLPGVRGLWQPAPVEYKRGRPKLGPYDEIQLCAQALCLEEMLGVAISAAALYYGEPHQRKEVALGVELREQTEKLAARLHELTRIGRTPLAIYEKKCESCSLLTLCLPKALGKAQAVGKYLLEALGGVGNGQP